MARPRDLASSAAELPTAAALPIMAPSIISQSARPAAAGARQYRTHPEDEQKKVAFERTRVRLPTFKSIFGRERTTTILLLMSGLRSCQNPEERSGNLDVPA
jgi:hypothetical protein